MKTVGKRKPRTDWQAADGLLRLVIELRGDKPFVKRGVYRFKTHAEADRAMREAYLPQKKKK